MEKMTLKEVEYIAVRLARELMSFEEPIPDFSTRFPNALESCLAMPFLTFSGKNPYPGLLTKAALLFYLMIKNHPFQNGNKRIAVTTLLVFLHKNGKWVKADTQELYSFTVWVAESLPTVRGDTVRAIGTFLKAHLSNR